MMNTLKLCVYLVKTVSFFLSLGQGRPTLGLWSAWLTVQSTPIRWAYTSIHRLQPVHWIRKMYQYCQIGYIIAWKGDGAIYGILHLRESISMGCPKCEYGWKMHDFSPWFINGCRVMCGKFKFLVWKTIHKIWHHQNMILLIECNMHKTALLLLHFILINVSNFDPQRNEI